MAALSQGAIVLADRWSEAYEAYHAHNGILSENEELRRTLGRLAFDDIAPQTTFYLQLDPREAMRRSHARGADFFDSKELDYHERHAAHYDYIAAQEPNWIVLDGTKPPEQLSEEVLRHIIGNLGLRAARIGQ